MRNNTICTRISLKLSNPPDGDVSVCRQSSKSLIILTLSQIYNFQFHSAAIKLINALQVLSVIPRHLDFLRQTRQYPTPLKKHTETKESKEKLASGASKLAVLYGRRYYRESAIVSNKLLCSFFLSLGLLFVPVVVTSSSASNAHRHPVRV